MPDSYHCVGCCHVLLENLREKRSVPLLKILEARPLKIAALGLPASELRENKLLLFESPLPFSGA